MEEENDRRTKFKFLKIVLVVCVCLALVTGIVVGLVAIKERDVFKKHKRPFTRRLCLTAECTKQASRILRNMDKLVNPCSDFYNFTCGNFMRYAKIPKDQTRVLVALENTHIVEEELLAAYSANSELFTKPIREIKSFYHQCTKSVRHQEKTTASLKRILMQLKWPPLYKRWDEEYSNTFNWLDLEAKLGELGMSPAFLSTELKFDMRNYSAAYISLDCTAPHLSEVMLTNKKVLREYKSIIRDFLEVMTGQPSEESATKLLNFLIKVEKIKPTRFDLSDANFFHSFKIFKTGNLADELDIDVSKLLNKILPNSVHVTNDTYISTNTYYCLTNITAMLKTADKKITANYMMWASVQSLLWILNRATRKLDFRMNRVQTGVQAPIPFYQMCLNFIDDFLPELSSAMYIKFNDAEHNRKSLNTIVTLIIEELMIAVNEATWMDEPTKRTAREKVRKLSYVISYDESIVQDKYLYSTYKDLKMTSDLVLNAIHIRRTAYCHMMESLHWPARERKASLLPLAHVINAYYHPGLNAIAIPAGITHGYIYSDKQEAYSNFGAVGIIIGHELSHVFDNVGRLYDAVGTYVNWWSEKSNSKFMAKSECFTKQYNNFTYGKLKMNGNLTLGENMADAGGMLLAYRAYLKWKQKYEVRPLKGLENYTMEQMFWISVGNTWCDKLRPERLDMFLKTDVHSLGNFRIMGPLSNIREFSKDFNCPSDSPMNRKEKCLIW